MKKRSFHIILITLIAMVAMSTGVLAEWKTTKAGVIFTTSGKPGYYTGWHTIGKAKYYFNKKNGVMATGWQTIKANKKSYRYYFGENGKLRKSFFDVDGFTYYGNAKGRVQYGFFEIAQKKYYADPTTGIVARKQWVDLDSGSYYFLADGTMAVNQLIQGNWVGADGRSTGIQSREGFVRLNRTVYYLRRGIRVTGWVETGGHKYYLSPELRTGWFAAGGSMYFADGDGAVVTNTWKGSKFLTSSGKMAVGWMEIGGKRYYFGPDGNRLTGGKVIDGKHYRFSRDGVAMKNTWYTKKNKARYYYGADGAALTGLQKLGGKIYYFSPNGKLGYGFIVNGADRYYANAKKGTVYQKKWFTKNGVRYYAMEDCRIATGLVVINGKTYVFSKTGRMYKTIRRTVNGKTYYLGKDGAAITNTWKKIKGSYYYFTADGTMAKNTVVDGYKIGADGKRGDKEKGSWITKNGKKYYSFGGKLATGLTVIDGNTYYFDSTGAMQTGIQEVDGKKRYFYPGGNMAKGISLAIGSKEYVINASGVVTSEKTIDVSGSSKGSNIAKFALKYVGNPYVYGGTSLTNGADCSGFVMTVFSNFGIKLLRVANDQMNGPGSYAGSGYKQGVTVSISTSSLLPGDLLFYGSGNYASHVAIYIGNGNIVHASNSQPYPAGGIKISNYNYQTPIKAVRYWS